MPGCVNTTLHDKMVEFKRRTMSDERGTMSTGRGFAGMVETMMTADSLRPE